MNYIVNLNDLERQIVLEVLNSSVVKGDRAKVLADLIEKFKPRPEVEEALKQEEGTKIPAPEIQPAQDPQS